MTTQHNDHLKGFKQRLIHYQLLINLIAFALIIACIVMFFWFKLATDHLINNDRPIEAALSELSYGTELSLNATQTSINHPNSNNTKQFNNSWDNVITPAFKQLQSAIISSQNEEYAQTAQRIKSKLTQLHTWQWRAIDVAANLSNQHTQYLYNQTFSLKAEQALTLINTLIQQTKSAKKRQTVMHLQAAHTKLLTAINLQYQPSLQLRSKNTDHSAAFLQSASNQILAAKQNAQLSIMQAHALTSLQHQVAALHQASLKLSQPSKLLAPNIARHWLQTQIHPTLQALTELTSQLQLQHQRVLQKQMSIINRSTQYIPFIALIVMICVGIINTIATKRISNQFLTPLNNITSAINQAKDGLLKKPLSNSSELEINLLSEAINTMSQNVKKARATNKGIIDTAIDPIITIDENGITQLANAALYDLLGFTEADIIGKNIKMIMPHGHRDKHNTYIKAYIDSGRANIIGKPRTVHAMSKSGELIPIRLTVSEFYVENDRYFSGILYDMRELISKDQQINQLDRLTKIDPLTQIGNRTMFDDVTAKLFEKSQQHHHCWGMLIIDIDNFKSVNDELGHEAGDQLLKHIANRLKHAIRDNDAVCRIGGDEFIVLLSKLTQPSDAEHVAKSLLKSINKPISLGSLTLMVSASIGIATPPGEFDSVKAVYKAADTALYHAKASGKNQFANYTSRNH